MDHPYYRSDLARIHHEGFGQHADTCAPGVLALLEPIGARGGTVLEIGCGTGLLTRHLTDAGLRVIATDASAAMLDIARAYAPAAVDHRVLRLPDDEVPPVAAIVSVGHALSYLESESDVEAALRSCAQAVQRGGLIALDLEDLSVLDQPLPAHPSARVTEDWVLVYRSLSDGPNHLAREHTVFVREVDGRYRRDFERHDNVLVDVAAVADRVFAAAGFHVDVDDGFGADRPMPGLKVIKAFNRS